ncbi:hypothetical protein [Xanthomonas campestris]|uniref:hypothetical protein n=1 Tax=Xanthomonas campestris TaxID=339 RepID=UPI0008A24478|nr:hypothetical protein [Xanthomonas campestris]MEB1149803.1 hypothetical protein [Xanthomonas campestris pv. campestris]MCC5096311.1 hypothetical protein [Xanthomonas campestris]MEA9582121.1 hypothetical protein [Xanthomonas campestris]MEA9590566.1 hypothetical protein [Xanthomonas campestris]MEA9621957.1 hypothetical protein [Xanthomonas campestris]
MSTAHAHAGTLLSRPASGWIRWGIPALWLGWVAVYVAGSLVRDGVPQQLDVLRWLAPVAMVGLTVRYLVLCRRWAQVHDAGDALEIVQQGQSQRVDLAQLRAVDPARVMPPVRLALKFHGERTPVMFLPAHGQDPAVLATTLLARAGARQAAEESMT